MGLKRKKLVRCPKEKKRISLSRVGKSFRGVIRNRDRVSKKPSRAKPVWDARSGMGKAGVASKVLRGGNDVGPAERQNARREPSHPSKGRGSFRSGTFPQAFEKETPRRLEENKICPGPVAEGGT